MRILLVEDKRAFASHVGRALECEGHSVHTAYDGDEAVRLGRTAAFDLMLLDVMLPRLNGYSVIRKLREDRLQIQTILVSARDSMEDIIQGLDAGADDYLTKPFALDVLLAKVRATERRVPLAPPQSVCVQDIVLRPHHCELQRGSRTEALTRTETVLLEALMRRAGTVVPYSTLMEQGWGAEGDASFDRLYVFIRALRGKLTKPGERECLHTVRGVGYRLHVDTE